jgi:hypothetical protein
VLVCEELGVVITDCVKEAEAVPVDGLSLVLISILVIISVWIVVPVVLCNVAAVDKLVRLAVTVLDSAASVTISVSVK